MLRVLFLDDEPYVLDGLRRMLRPQRDAWHMDFETCPERASRALGAGDYDVLVCETRLRGVDGSALLADVRRRSPRTVRIVLSGDTSLESALRAARVAHRHLAKPCEPGELRAAVQRACDLEALLRDPALRAAVARVGELPVVPCVYRELVDTLGEPEVDLRRVATVVAQDPALTAKILRLVNSSWFGLRHEVASLAQATAYLGVRALRDLVLTAEVFAGFEAGGAAGRRVEGEQRHALLVARIARRIPDDPRAAEEAFLAGMLHDVGRLVLDASLPDAATRIRLAREGTGEPTHVVERRLLGVSHAEIGASLLGLWGVPHPVVEAVAHHHRPARVAVQTGTDALVAVHVAAALADELAEPLVAADTRLDERLLERLGLAGRLPEWRELARAEAEAGCAAV